MWVVFAVVSAVGNAIGVSLSLFMLLCRVFMVVTALCNRDASESIYGR